MRIVLVDGAVVDVSLIGSGVPRAVQIVFTEVGVGQHVVVRGRLGGAVWSVPGGEFISTGEQVVLIDNRAPVNVPVVYEVLVDGVVFTSMPITVPFPGGRYLLQSLDGRTVVRFTWVRNNDPRSWNVRTEVFNVAGRARPVVRYDVPGGESGEVIADTVGPDAETMRALLSTGRPVVLRTDGGVEDFAPSEIVMVLGVSRVLTGGRDAFGRPWRRWSLPFTVIDDPEPSVRLTAWTWDDFDAAWDGRPWGDFDAHFDGLTWNDFDTTPWGDL